MRNTGKKTAIVLTVLLAGVMMTGCGKKAADAESTQVIQISVAPPSPTSTPAPDQVDSAAVTTNGNLTMVNEYLADQSTSGAADSTDTSVADGSTDNNSDNNTDDNADSSDAGTGESDGSEEQ